MKILFKSVIKDKNLAKFLFLDGEISRIPRSNSKEFKIKKATFVTEGEPLSKKIQNILLDFTDRIWPLLLSGEKEQGENLLTETFELFKKESLKSNKGTLDFILPPIESFFEKVFLFRKAKFMNNNDIISRVPGLDDEKMKIEKTSELIKEFLTNYEGKLKEFLSDFLMELIEAEETKKEIEYTEESEETDEEIKKKDIFIIKIGKFKEYFEDKSYIPKDEFNLENNLVVLKKILDGIRIINTDDFNKKARDELYTENELELVSYIKEKFELMLKKLKLEENNKTEN